MNATLPITDFNSALRTFLDTSPTPFHAVAAMAGCLEAAGFIGLDEADRWVLEPGKGY